VSASVASRAPPRFWTEEMIAQARSLWDQGLSCTAIGKRLGCSEDAVYGLASRKRFPTKSGAPRMPRPPKRLTVPRSCLLCGQPFFTSEAYIRAKRGSYCSPVCGNTSRRIEREAEFQLVIWDNCIPEPMSGCWLWTMGTTGAGYGALTCSRPLMAEVPSCAGMLPASAPSLAERAPQAAPSCPPGVVEIGTLSCGSAWLSPPRNVVVPQSPDEGKTALPSPERLGLRPSRSVSPRCIELVRDRETWRHVS
jgi:hypothetical protein